MVCHIILTFYFEQVPIEFLKDISVGKIFQGSPFKIFIIEEVRFLFHFFIFSSKMQSTLITNFDSMRDEIFHDFEAESRTGFVWSYADSPLNIDIDFSKVEKDNKKVKLADKPVYNNSYNADFSYDVETSPISRFDTERRTTLSTPAPNTYNNNNSYNFLDDEDDDDAEFSPNSIDLSNLYKQSDEINHKIESLIKSGKSNSDEIKKLKEQRSNIWKYIDLMEDQISANTKQNSYELQNEQPKKHFNFLDDEETENMDEYENYEKNISNEVHDSPRQPIYLSDSDEDSDVSFISSSYINNKTMQNNNIHDSDNNEYASNSNDSDLSDVIETFPIQITENIDPNEMNKMNEVNQTIFHHKSFRGVQASVIHAALHGEDVFVLMPTGGGKSLCFQLPEIIQGGLTIVISPLVALIEDQVHGLRQLNFNAQHFSRNTTEKEYKNIIASMNNGSLQFLYITPEKLLQSRKLMEIFQNLYINGKITRFVIDEAHCVSHWGHDFRPDYNKLRIIRDNFPNVPIMALTATATKNVREDIKMQLNIPHCKEYQQSFDRPNLVYEVVEKTGSLNKHCEFIENWIKEKGYRNECGLIFCLSKNDTREIAKNLNDHGFSAGFYHAELDQNKKTEIHQKWLRGDIKIIAATVAFGMGIDKPNVRFVIHHTMPQSLEAYYQESGRGGRDGKETHCLLMFSMADQGRVTRLISKSENGPKDKKRIAIEKELLIKMTEYAMSTTTCRRVMLLEYFGQTGSPKNCKCDFCQRDKGKKIIKADFTDHAKNIAILIKEISQKRKKAPFPTNSYLVTLYTGSKLQNVIKAGDDTLTSFGKGVEFKGRRQTFIHKILLELQKKQIITEGNTHIKQGVVTFFRPGKNYNLINMPDFRLFLDDTKNELSEEDQNLHNKLLKLRGNLSNIEKKKSSSIINDNSLLQLVKEKPKTVEEVAKIIKSKKYSQVFFNAMYSNETIQQSPYFSSPSKKKRASKKQANPLILNTNLAVSSTSMPLSAPSSSIRALPSSDNRSNLNLNTSIRLSNPETIDMLNSITRSSNNQKI